MQSNNDPTPGGNGAKYPFAMPTPGFDPSYNKSIAKFYKKRGDDGPMSSENAIEDSVDAIADAQIAELREHREVSPEQEKIIRETIKLNNSCQWIEALRPQLMSQKTIPVEYFNRLNQQHEQSIAYVASIQASSERILADRDNQIKELQKKLTETQDEELKKQLKECEKRRKNTDGQVWNLEKKLKMCESREKKAYAQIEYLEEQFKELEEYESKVSDQRRDLKEQVYDLQKKLKKADDQVWDLKKRVKDPKKPTKAQEEKLKIKLMECEEYKQRADDQVGDLKKQIKDLKKQLNDTQDDELKIKLQECKEHGEQAENKIKELEAIIKKGKKSPKSDQEEDIQAVEEKVRNDEALEQCRKTATELREKNISLEQRVRASLRREQDLKDQIRSFDRDIADLRGLIRSLERQLEAKGRKPEHRKKRKTNNTSSDSASEYDIDELKKLVEEYENERDDFQEEIEQLKAQLAAFDTTADAGTDAALKLKTLSEALGVQETRNRELIEKNKVLEAQRHRWMSQIKGHEPMWWDQVEALTQSKRNIDVKLLALYERFGFKDANMDGESIVDRMVDIIDRTTTGEGVVAGGERRSLPLTVIRLAGELEAAIRTASMTQRRAAELQRELVRARTNAEADKKERLKEIHIFEDEELARRVDARTQMYRIHRRQYLGNIFGAGERLRAITRGITDANTRDALNQVYNDYLSFASLPNASTAAREAAEEAAEEAGKKA